MDVCPVDSLFNSLRTLVEQSYYQSMMIKKPSDYVSLGRYAGRAELRKDKAEHVVSLELFDLLAGLESDQDACIANHWFNTGYYSVLNAAPVLH